MDLQVYARLRLAARAERPALRAKLDRLADHLAEGVLDPVDYQRQRDRLREKIAAAEAERETATVKHRDVDAVLAFAEHTLTNAARLWEHASPPHKLALQRFLLPAGLAWSGELLTVASPSAFTVLQELAGPKSRLASPTGGVWNRLLFARLRADTVVREARFVVVR